MTDTPAPRDVDKILCCPDGCTNGKQYCSAAATGQKVRAALAAAGYVVVPREPTLDMIVAAIERKDETGDAIGLFYGAIYRAMIAAAPTGEPT